VTVVLVAVLLNARASRLRHACVILSSTRNSHARSGAAQLPRRTQRRRRSDRTGRHHGRVPARPATVQDARGQLRVQLLERDPQHHCHAFGWISDTSCCCQCFLTRRWYLLRKVNVRFSVKVVEDSRIFLMHSGILQKFASPPGHLLCGIDYIWVGKVENTLFSNVAFAGCDVVILCFVNNCSLGFDADSKICCLYSVAWDVSCCQSFKLKTAVSRVRGVGAIAEMFPVLKNVTFARQATTTDECFLISSYTYAEVYI